MAFIPNEFLSPHDWLNVISGLEGLMRSTVYNVNGDNVQCRQWRIEDFSDRGCQPQGDANLLFGKTFPKTA